MKWILLIFLMFLGLNNFSLSQVTSIRKIEISSIQDTILLDSFSVYPQSFKLYCDDVLMDNSTFYLNGAKSLLYIHHDACAGKFTAEFRVFPYNLTEKIQKRDTLLMFHERKGKKDMFLQTSSNQMEDLFGSSTLSKSGSISRGITFGNNQDLGVKSSLNLELNGDLGSDLKILASISDDNIPIQPDGNTNKLREFDKVFVQVYNDKLKLIAGDFWIYRPKGYFLNYNKRAQGLSLEYDFTDNQNVGWKTQTSGAFSKGKFNRQIITGVEGNQGPYRLRGAENEPFITILGGTEKVFIDGRLLSRGQEYDYVINYNTAEVVFTSRNQITKDSRIVVEFQYSDLNYARSLFQSANFYQSKKIDFWFNVYSEQDAKNQTIQQDLSIPQKRLLSQIGDTLHLAHISSIDSIGFFENQIMYRMVDTLGFDSVLVHSINPSDAVYRAIFTHVGKNNGNYILKNYLAQGKLFEWVAPISGVPQGDYEPTRLMVTPKKNQMLTMGGRYKISEYISAETEFSLTKNDINTFSRLDKHNDNGLGVKTKLLADFPVFSKKNDFWSLQTNLDFEVLDKYFKPIEQYRSVEFDRDWNTRNKAYEGNQLATSLGVNFVNKEYGNVKFEGQQFLIGSDFEGYRASTMGDWSKNGFKAEWDGSYLESKAESKSQFLRHKSVLTQNVKWLKLGYKDDHERNIFLNKEMPLAKNSYQFWDYEFFVENGDSINNQYRIFFRERYDWISDSFSLRNAAKSQTTGGEIRLKIDENQTLNMQSSYRQLNILDNQLIAQTPENSLLGRIDYDVRLWKNALTWNTFYEVGSGLELKREFIYMQVNTGQGIYTWIDYNGDGIKDLNEFEIAQYVDQASYIRVFTPGNEYTKTYSNEFNQTIFWRPERIWSKKSGFLKYMSTISNQLRVRINRKTNLFDGIDAFNPLYSNVRDTSLISTNFDFKNTLFFNRTSSIFGMEWTFHKMNNKSLLASGFDSRGNDYNELNARWNITNYLLIEGKYQLGRKIAMADYTVGRNFSVNYYSIKPILSYQSSTAFRISVGGRYEEKNNHVDYGGEQVIISEISSQVKYNQLEKSSFQSEFKVISMKYNGLENTAVAFEMLESLRPGVNYTWNVVYQRSLSKSLQLSLQYNGRKSVASKMIHSASMEVRAFF